MCTRMPQGFWRACQVTEDGVALTLGKLVSGPIPNPAGGVGSPASPVPSPAGANASPRELRASGSPEFIDDRTDT